jgi:hypothetical protein
MCIIVIDMKKTYILILFAAVLMVSGCDFLRKVAGRPTSEEIDIKREEIVRIEEQQAEQARQQARLDSINFAREQARLAREAEAARDSLAAMSVLNDRKCKMFDTAKAKITAPDKLSHRYYIIIGSFRDVANAEKFVKRVSKVQGMNPVMVPVRTGMVAVGVCATDKITQIADVIDEVLMKSFCPLDAWILVNENK